MPKAGRRSPWRFLRPEEMCRVGAGRTTIANGLTRTAYDLAKDQIAGDERTVLKDKSEVRAVLEYDASDRRKAYASKGRGASSSLPPEARPWRAAEVVADAKARGASESKVATALAAKTAKSKEDLGNQRKGEEGGGKGSGAIRRQRRTRTPPNARPASA